MSISRASACGACRSAATTRRALAAFEKRFKACVALSGPFQRSADFTAGRR